MATISVSLSQSTFNTLASVRAGSGSAHLSGNVDLFFQGAYDFSAHHTNATLTLTQSTARLDFADAAYSRYDGVAFANPNATVGAATATSLEEYLPGTARLTFGGTLNAEYAYDPAAGTAQIALVGSHYTSATLQTVFAVTSPSYNAILGNGLVGLHGAIDTDRNGLMSGVLTSITAQADKFATTSMNGSFNVSGDTLRIGQNLGSSTLSGTLTGLASEYTDGSYLRLTGAAVAATGSTLVDEHLFANGADFPGDDVVTIALPASVGTSWPIATGPGNDMVTLKGGAGALSLNAGTGNDTVTLTDAGHTVDGGTGTDTAIFAGTRASYVVGTVAGTTTVRATSATLADTLANVERLQFSDVSVALDVNGTAGQTYRIYQAAFNRTPDMGGLGYWISQMDKGTSLKTVASGFVDSAEFKTLYGAAPTHLEMVNKFYENVLHRAGEAGGVSFWVGVLDSNAVTPADVLAGFSESAENQAALVGAISNGISYTHFA